MQSEVAKLDILLNHTIEHSKRHVEELNNLAQKAKELSEATVHDDIAEAAEHMNRANKILENALEKLRGNKSSL